MGLQSYMLPCYHHGIMPWCGEHVMSAAVQCRSDARVQSATLTFPRTRLVSIQSTSTTSTKTKWFPNPWGHGRMPWHAQGITQYIPSLSGLFLEATWLHTKGYSAYSNNSISVTHEDLCISSPAHWHGPTGPHGSTHHGQHCTLAI